MGRIQIVVGWWMLVGGHGLPWVGWWWLVGGCGFAHCGPPWVLGLVVMGS